MLKFFKVQRVVFNHEKKDYEKDIITMHESDYDKFVAQPEYQISLRDKSVATPIELKIIQEWPSHKEYLAEAKKKRAEGLVEVIEEVKESLPVEHTEKSLKKLKVEELNEIIAGYKVENTALNNPERIEIILFQQELVKENKE
jgi:hypothetical protein